VALIAAAPDLAAELAACKADLAEARAEIAALRGLPEGAVCPGWHWWASGRHWVYRDGALAFVWLDDGVCYWTTGEGNDHTVAPTLRGAMRAALAALGVKS
jgi:hypothetical protein